MISIIAEKEKENFKIDRLRIIDKFKTDYNLILNIHRPKITNQIAEDNVTLWKNQLGICKHKSATGGALTNKSIIETARINNEPLAIQ